VKMANNGTFSEQIGRKREQIGRKRGKKGTNGHRGRGKTVLAAQKCSFLPKLGPMEKVLTAQRVRAEMFDWRNSDERPHKPARSFAPSRSGNFRCRLGEPRAFNLCEPHHLLKLGELAKRSQTLELPRIGGV
jgi:hypothetical protein